jgi:hypothetical protein
MKWLNGWFSKLVSPSKPKSRFRSFRPRFEALEDRELLTLTPPILLAPIGGASPLATFSWSAQPDAAYYNFQLTNLGTHVNLTGTALTSTTLTLGAPLVLANTYTWAVEAVDASGNLGPWSAPATISITNLAQPTLIGPSGPSSPQPVFSWSPLAGAIHYSVWVKNQTTGQAMNITGLTTSTWTPAAPLAQGATYIWEVQGFDSNGIGGPWSNALTFTEAVLPAPTLIGPTGTAVLQPTISWNPVTGADHYDIWLQNQTTGQTIRDTNVSGTTWVPSSPLIVQDYYSVSVRAVDPNGYNGQWSASQTFTAYALAAPTLTSPIGSSTASAAFTWNAVAGADHYDIWAQNVQTGQVLRNQNVTGTTWTPASPFTPGDRYNWCVRAIDSANHPGPWSSVQTFTAYVLAAPTLIGPTGSSATLPTFSWNAVTGADHYDIWVQDAQTGQVLRNQNVAGTTWAPSSPLIQGHGYSWWVRAVSSAGVAGGWSTGLNISVPSLAVPTLTGPIGSATLLPTFTWNAVTGADHYDIWVQNVQTGQVLRNQNVTGTTWTPAGPLTPTAKYNWWVRAIDSVNSPGPWSATQTFTAYVLAAPGLIGPTGSSTTLPTFSWNAVAGADHYDIWVQDAQTGQVLRNQNVAGTTWTPASPLIRGHGYTWWVRAVNNTGIAGVWSAGLSFTVPALALPTLIGPSGSASSLPTFTWNAVTGADHYDIWIQNVQTGQVLRNQNVTGTTWTPATSLTSGAKYNWWVRAIDSANSAGPWSATETFTVAVV